VHRTQGPLRQAIKPFGSPLRAHDLVHHRTGPVRQGAADQVFILALLLIFNLDNFKDFLET
jgi:hypothetical protein